MEAAEIDIREGAARVITVTAAKKIPHSPSGIETHHAGSGTAAARARKAGMVGMKDFISGFLSNAASSFPSWRSPCSRS